MGLKGYVCEGMQGDCKSCAWLHRRGVVREVSRGINGLGEESGDTVNMVLHARASYHREHLLALQPREHDALVSIVHTAPDGPFLTVQLEAHDIPLMQRATIDK
jgi:hypothetical protein